MWLNLLLQVADGLVGTVALSLVIALVRRVLARPAEHRKAKRRTILRYGTMYGGTGVVCTVISVGFLAGLVFRADEGSDRWVGIAVFGILSAGVLVMVIEGHRRRVMVDEDGIAVRGWFGSERRV